MELEPIVDCEGMNGYRIRVLPYLFGQFRIQILDTKIPDDFDPALPRIVREMCTYQPDRCLQVVAELAASDDPEAHAESLERPWNCDGNGSRIRLDNQERDLQSGEPGASQ